MSLDQTQAFREASDEVRSHAIQSDLRSRQLEYCGGAFAGTEGGNLEYLIGVLLACAVAGLAAGMGFDRDRSFTPTVLMVVASFYVLFALIGGSQRALVLEILVAIGFLLIALLGYKRNLWLVAAAIAGHGVFDFVHGSFIENPGVPQWWPGFCGAFDVLFGAWVAVLLLRRSHPLLPRSSQSDGRL